MHTIIVLLVTVFLHGQDPQVVSAVMPSPEVCMATAAAVKGKAMGDVQVEDVEWACFEVQKKDKV